jgi:hypothetical protein
MVKVLDETVDMLRIMGDHLVPYNYPKNHLPLPAAAILENDIGLFKTSVAEVDGYTVRIHFSKMDYDDHFVESCQINSENTPFLPFNVIVKVGQKLLGGHELSLIERCEGGKMFWCWAVCTDRVGRPIPWVHPIKALCCEYDGFAFHYVKPGEVYFH